MTADTYDVLTLTEGKQAVGIENADAALYAKLEGYITAASRILDDYIGPVVKRDLTEVYDGYTDKGLMRTKIILRHRPVLSVSSITESSSSLAASAYFAEPSAVLSTSSSYSGIVHRRVNGFESYWKAGYQNITVVYSAGRFANTASVERKYKRATSIILENLWRDQQPGVVTFDEYQVPHQSFPTFAMPKVVREMFPGEYGQQETWGFA